MTRHGVRGGARGHGDRVRHRQALHPGYAVGSGVAARYSTLSRVSSMNASSSDACCGDSSWSAIPLAAASSPTAGALHARARERAVLLAGGGAAAALDQPGELVDLG